MKAENSGEGRTVAMCGASVVLASVCKSDELRWLVATDGWLEEARGVARMWLDTLHRFFSQLELRFAVELVARYAELAEGQTARLRQAKRA
jgi:hypothetical protein